jgi:hypothetical protein
MAVCEYKLIKVGWVGGNAGPMYSVVFAPSPPSHYGSVWVLPVISLLFTNTVSPVRACLIIYRVLRTQKEDDCGPLRIQSSMVGMLCVSEGPRGTGTQSIWW